MYVLLDQTGQSCSHCVRSLPSLQEDGLPASKRRGYLQAEPHSLYLLSSPYCQDHDYKACAWDGSDTRALILYSSLFVRSLYSAYVCFTKQPLSFIGIILVQLQDKSNIRIRGQG